MCYRTVAAGSGKQYFWRRFDKPAFPHERWLRNLRQVLTPDVEQCCGGALPLDVLQVHSLLAFAPEAEAHFSSRPFSVNRNRLIRLHSSSQQVPGSTWVLWAYIRRLCTSLCIRISMYALGSILLTSYVHTSTIDVHGNVHHIHAYVSATDGCCHVGVPSLFCVSLVFLPLECMYALAITTRASSSAAYSTRHNVLKPKTESFRFA